MSTAPSGTSCQDEIGCHNELRSFLCGLEADPFLFEPEQLRERLVALDDLDAEFGGFDSQEFTKCMNPRIHQRVKALRGRLEAANAELYQSVRSEIVRSGQPRALFQWLQNSASQKESEIPLSGLGFDFRDELVSGILQLREPSESDLQRSPEMAPYQPTPVRHILHLIAASALSEDDVLVDLGSGLGHVPLLVSILTGVRTLGVELQSDYVTRAQECARSLRLSRVRFVAGDARDADLSTGSVFYLYSPFTGSILTEVLGALRKDSTSRAIRICSLGPCTSTLADERWLKANTRPDPERIAIFESR